MWNFISFLCRFILYFIKRAQPEENCNNQQNNNNEINEIKNQSSKETQHQNNDDIENNRSLPKEEKLTLQQTEPKLQETKVHLICAFCG